ncbi:MAG TPA: DedA family protein [Candidatus Polarisedimenticolia bacterium]|nr:DedA family protein [Candidatus Polarisedimenticolia bacterium]
MLHPVLASTSLLETLESFGPNLCYPGLYGLLLLSGVGVPLPEDLTLATSGYLISKGLMSWVPTVLVGIAGVITGDQFVYSLGKAFGPKVLAHRWLALALPAERYERVRNRFLRHGPKMIFFARFAAGLRGPVFLTAGVLQMPRRRFLLWDLAGAAINVPLYVLVGYLVGPRLESLLAGIRHFWQLVVLLLLLVIAGMLLRAVVLRRRAMAEGSREVVPAPGGEEEAE